MFNAAHTCCERIGQLPWSPACIRTWLGGFLKDAAFNKCTDTRKFARSNSVSGGGKGSEFSKKGAMRTSMRFLRWMNCECAAMRRLPCPRVLRFAIANNFCMFSFFFPHYNNIVDFFPSLPVSNLSAEAVCQREWSFASSQLNFCDDCTFYAAYHSCWQF